MSQPSPFDFSQPDPTKQPKSPKARPVRSRAHQLKEYAYWGGGTATAGLLLMAWYGVSLGINPRGDQAKAATLIIVGMTMLAVGTGVAFYFIRLWSNEPDTPAGQLPDTERREAVSKVGIALAGTVAFSIMMCGGIVFGPGLFRRWELEAEAAEWERKRVVQPHEADDYRDFCARYRREFGREWDARRP